MADTKILDTLASLDEAERRLTDAKEVVKDARDTRMTAFDALVDVAVTVEFPEIAEAAEGVRYCVNEIDTLVNGEDRGEKVLRTKVKELSISMRAAARTGDANVAKGAEADLASVEADLDEVKGEIRDLRRARRDHEKRLLTLVRSQF